jgi:hypothetical protein
MNVDVIVDKHYEIFGSGSGMTKVVLKGETGEGFSVKLIIVSKAEDSKELERLFPIDSIRSLTLTEGKQKTIA